MSFNDYFGIVLKVMIDPRVIITFVMMIAVIHFANMIVHYRKKKKVPKKKIVSEEKKPKEKGEKSENEEEK